jgi:predicted secreted protein
MTAMAATVARLAWALAALGLVSGCGAAGGATGGGARPSPVPSTVVTEADNGHTVQLLAGGAALLRLSSRYTWSEPRVTGSAVRIAGGARGGPDYEEWTISAVSAGQAKVGAAGRPRCTPGQLCPDLIVAFSVTVAVS